MNNTYKTNAKNFLRINWRDKNCFQIVKFIELYNTVRKKRGYGNLILPIAFDGKNFFKINFNEQVAVLLGGLTGKGKTTLASNMILFSLILFEENSYEIFVIERKRDLSIFKDKVNYVGDDALKYLKKLKKRLEKRKKEFDRLGVDNIKNYNALAKENFLAEKKYIFIYIDEYLRCKESVEIFRFLVETGRAYGFRFVVTAHTMHAEFIDTYVRSQFELRMTFKCNSRSILEVNIGQDVATDFLKDHNLGRLKKGNLLVSDDDSYKILNIPYMPRYLVERALVEME